MRKRHKFTQEEMATKLNIKRATYGAYERDEITPPYEKVQSLANIFGVKVSELIDRKEESTDIYSDICNIIDKLKNTPTYQDRELDEEAKMFLNLTMTYILDAFEIREKRNRQQSSTQSSTK